MRKTTAVSLLLTLLLSPAFIAEAKKKPKKRAAKDTFLRSDDYRDGEEVVNVFLQDEDYGKMVEDLEFRDVEFDWTWVKGTYKKPTKLESLGFSPRDFKTVSIPEVSNHSASLEPGIEEHVGEVFELAMKRFDLEIVEQGADLELGIAIVDYKADSTFIFFTTLEPFIELELKLTHGEETLLLIREQEHARDPRAAASDVASDLLRFFR